MRGQSIVFTLAVTASLSLSAEPTWQLEFPQDEQWSVEYSATSGDEAVVEYTVADEPDDAWSQLVTMQSAPVQEPDFRVVVMTFLDGLRIDCPSFMENKHQDKPGSYATEWRHAGCNGYPATREYARFEYRDGTMQVLRYTYYPEQIQPDFDEWVKIIDSAKLD